MIESVLPNEWSINDLFIRKADISDAQTILEIKNACHYLHIYDENFYISDISEYKDILTRNTDKQSTIYCIIKNAITLGFFHIYYNYPSENIIWMEKLIIHPHKQKEGIGKVIMQQVEEQSAVKGMTTSRVKVYLKNYTALRFWLSCGYTSIIDFNSEDIFEQYSNRVSFILGKSLA